MQPGSRGFSATAPKVIDHLPKGLQSVDVDDRTSNASHELMIEGGNVSMSVTLQLQGNWTPHSLIH